jgi:hypothetical protein
LTGSASQREGAVHGKRVQFDDETWRALDLLGHDRMMELQELADEAFRDLLAKHGRPTDLKSQLRQSLDGAPPAGTTKATKATRKPKAGK